MLTLPSMKSQVRLACRPVERAATERVCGARHTGQRPLSAVSRQGQTPARSVATSSRVTLSSPPITSLSRSSGQSPARSSLHAPVLGTSGGRRTLFHVQRAGLATSAEAQSTPAPDITRKPENPEDPEVYEGAPPSLVITDRAAQHLAKVADRESNFDLALRIAVESGGCHGYQYKMELTDEMEDDDFRFSVGDKVHLVVDSTSLRLIKGSTIDYVTELIGSQFAIFSNPQAKGAGCGCGVSWEPNL